MKYTKVIMILLVVLLLSGCASDTPAVQVTPQPDAPSIEIVETPTPATIEPIATEVVAEEPDSDINSMYTFAMIQMSLPQEPVHEIADKLYESRFAEGDIFSGISGYLNLYHAKSADEKLDVYIRIMNIIDEDARRVIDAIIEGAYTTEEERIDMSGSNVDAFFRDVEADSIWESLVDTSKESGGREIVVVQDGKQETIQERYGETSDDRKVLGRVVNDGYCLVEIIVVSSDNDSYEDGIKVLESVRLAK